MACFLKEKIKYFKAFKNCQVIRPESQPQDKLQFPVRVTQKEFLHHYHHHKYISAFIYLCELSQGRLEKNINFTCAN